MGKPSRETLAAQMQIVNEAIAPWKTQVLFTLFKIGLFDLLDNGSADCPAIARKLGLPSASLERLLDCGVLLEYIGKDEIGYHNSAMASEALVRDKPGYMGNWLALAARWYDSFGKLEQSIRANEAVEDVNFSDDPVYKEIFVRGMIDYTRSRGRDILSHLDLSGRKRLLDVGCGPATYSAMFCQRYPTLKCTGLDLPHALEIAEEHVREMSMTRQIELVAADYRKAASLGHDYDVVFLSHILHQEDMQVCVELLRKCYTALEPGGLVVVQAMFPGDGGVQSPYAALHDLLTLVVFPGGKNHTIDDISGWLSETGFIEVRHLRLSLLNTNSLVVGCKPRS